MAGADSQLALFADVLGPQAVGGNVMRYYSLYLLPIRPSYLQTLNFRRIYI